MDNLKNDLEEIFEILYELDKLELASLIQKMYFVLDEELDDDDYEYYSDTESDEYVDNYVDTDEELEIQVDDNGFMSLS
jgi:hypothetical protein